MLGNVNLFVFVGVFLLIHSNAPEKLCNAIIQPLKAK